jgi:hypothetical protein
MRDCCLPVAGLFTQGHPNLLLFWEDAPVAEQTSALRTCCWKPLRLRSSSATGIELGSSRPRMMIVLLAVTLNPGASA